ncbi:hypothetical protein C463_14460 [Halorubrum californiense DSM 19288]|uniref:Uncharacterized protein n=1 Tax=Halorubrum californiense DSM 19288 TaxID=1227465 RepID=M0E1G9_9EURY|nr:hypothetical protein C463_14460 [Halorubrum californiense DSM 19288]
MEIAVCDLLFELLPRFAELHRIFICVIMDNPTCGGDHVVRVHVLVVQQITKRILNNGGEVLALSQLPAIVQENI